MISLDNSSSEIANLGEPLLFFEKHINKVTESCYCKLRNMKSVDFNFQCYTII